MPAGHIHAKVTLNLTWIGFGALLGVGVPVQDAAAFSMGILTSFWLSPDLDSAQSWPAQAWIGPPRWIWRKLRESRLRIRGKKLFRHHGLMHMLIIGSIIRISLVLLFFTIGLATASLVSFVVRGVPVAPSWLSDLFGWRLFYIWVEGIMLGDAVHIFMDIVFTRIKRGR